MGASTSIAWTDATWNPTVGCTRVSAGCENCYAERVAHRFANVGSNALSGLTRESGKWNGRVRFLPYRLDDPLRWCKPRRIFVNSMSDLFHESLSDEEIDRVVVVMALAHRHTFQILTKRPERMRAYFTDDDVIRRIAVLADARRVSVPGNIPEIGPLGHGSPGRRWWPLRNVWLGVSVEDQPTADERTPILLETPAAKRFVSYEPALSAVDFEPWLYRCGPLCTDGPGLDWIIVGGESGPGARPFDIAWARSTVSQCKSARVACFVKQLGAKPYSMTGSIGDDYFGSYAISPRPGEEGRWYPVGLCRKADDPSEWPEDLRVQEFSA